MHAKKPTKIPNFFLYIRHNIIIQLTAELEAGAQSVESVGVASGEVPQLIQHCRTQLCWEEEEKTVQCDHCLMLTVHAITFGHRTITDQYTRTHVTDHVRLWSVKMSERDNARIINYIAYCTLGARIQQHYSYLGPGYWERLMTVWVQPHGFYKLTSWLTQHITC